MKLYLASLIALAALAQSPRKQASPLDNLPKNIEVLTHFGERADFSPSNSSVAFMAKSFGDAFTIDLKTRQVRCLTCNIPGAAFLRVMHLSSGDYILIGAEHFTDIHTSRGRDNELWFLSKTPGSKPVRLGQKMSEGAALSKQSMLISFSETSGQNPALPRGASNLMVAEVDLTGPQPQLKNKHVVHSSPDNSCTLEAQDFFDNDRKMTFTCYEPKGLGSVWTIDLATKQVVNHTRSIGSYNEVEGIFPGGTHTCVESDRQGVLMGSTKLFRDVDIWKLKLDGTGSSFERLTYFNDYEGWKSSNPVVSTDGRMMAFQVAKSSDEAGVGYGILLMHFKK
ncbi:TolB family protein [Paludibaculum fermentans]|uniref:TolB family protein n=1 Tax=Paludibaculum fermentans TaxID=1473598 RepID=UPI003EBB3B15